MHDLTSALTSYGIAGYALLFQQDLGTYAAVGGLILVVVRIAGDLPKAISAWRKLFKGDDNDS
jgi:hypothetical protein